MTKRTEIREMTLNDIEEAAHISIDTFEDYYVIASKMGKGNLERTFFPSIVNSPFSGAFAIFKDNEMYGYICYITDFKRYNQESSLRTLILNLIYTLSAVLKLRITIKDLYNVFMGLRWIKQQAVGISATVGPLAVSTEIKGTQEGGMGAWLLMRAVFDQLSSQGIDKVWATVDTRNYASLKFGESMGFKEQSTIQLWGMTDIFRVKDLRE